MSVELALGSFLDMDVGDVCVVDVLVLGDHVLEFSHVGACSRHRHLISFYDLLHVLWLWRKVE